MERVGTCNLVQPLSQMNSSKPQNIFLDLIVIFSFLIMFTESEGFENSNIECGIKTDIVCRTCAFSDAKFTWVAQNKISENVTQNFKSAFESFYTLFIGFSNERLRRHAH